jgi:methyl-accepting chemotaxis protein
MQVDSALLLHTDRTRAELVHAIEGLVSHTEEIFLKLAEGYPRLLREMETSLSAAIALVHSFQGDTDESTSGLYGRLQRTSTVIREAGSTFEEMHARDRELFGRLDTTIERLDGLRELIDRIREDSVEMELVSLNAMTVALKTGTAGRAFSYITEELKRLSSQTIALTEEITERGEELGREFSTFRGSLSEVQSFQQKLFQGFRTRLDASFDEVKAAVEQLVSSLRDVCARARSVRDPLTAIMEGIQFQDLIRQSLDHVIIGVNELHELAEMDDEEALLDELSFLHKLPDLCAAVLDDVSDRIRDSLSTFRDNSREAANIIRAAENRRAELVENALSGDGEHRSLTDLFATSTSMLHDLLGDLQHSMKMKESIGQRAGQVSRMVKQVNENFNAFATLVTRFHSIDVASRIEVAKQTVLQEMSGTVEEMNALTHRIDNDVEQSLDYTKEFITKTGAVITDLESVFRGENRFVQEFAQQISESYETLHAANDNVAGSLSGFSVFTKAFLNMFETSKKDLDRLEILISDIGAIKATLSEIKHATWQRMQSMLEDRGLSEWRIENRKLQEIIQRFTIFTHKQTAAELGGFDVESGQDAGEVTLF